MHMLLTAIDVIQLLLEYSACYLTQLQVFHAALDCGISGIHSNNFALGKLVASL